jgi:hypothetical protein
MGRFITIPGKKYCGEVHKKSEAPVEPVFRFYGRFLMVFWEKAGVERGFLMVNLWWTRGETGQKDGAFSRRKTCHILKIYLVLSGVRGAWVTDDPGDARSGRSGRSDSRDDLRGRGAALRLWLAGPPGCDLMRAVSGRARN